MSVRRPQRDCALCLKALDEEAHRAIFHAQQESSSLEEATARIARQVGVQVTPDELRAHIQYHRPLQPAPRTRFRAEEALERSVRLPARLQDLLTLVSRVPALSGTQLAELFYWSGDDAHLPSARAACYRDLSKLVKQNFLYRWYPPVAAGPTGTRVRAWQHRLSFYFLGRDSTPLIEERDGYEPQRGRDWFAAPEELSDSHELFSLSAAAESVVSLGRQAARRLAAGQVLETPLGPAELELEPANWFGASRLGLSGRRVPPAGLAAFSLRAVERPELSFLSPFIYEYDDGLRPLQDVAEQTLRYVDVKRSGLVGERFPELKRSQAFPPILVIAADPFRLESLRRSVQAAAKRRGATTNLPVVVCSDQASVSQVGLVEDAWVSIWDASQAPRRYRLPEVLCHQAKALKTSGLEAKARLRYQPEGEGGLRDPLTSSDAGEAVGA